MGKFIDGIVERYTDDDGLDFSNILKDVGVATTAYGILNPNNSEGLGNFFGTGGQQQPVGYMGGIPNYTATQGLADDAFAQTTTDAAGGIVPRRPGSMGRRYFDDLAYTQSETEPTMGMTQADVAAKAAEAADNQALFDQLTTGAAGARTASTGNRQEDEAGYINFDDFDITGGGTTGGTTDTTADTNAAFNTFLSGFRGRGLVEGDVATMLNSGYPIADIASGLNVDATALQNYIDSFAGTTTIDTGETTDTTVTETAGLYDAINRDDGFSTEEQDIVAGIIGDKKATIGDVAQEFGVEQNAVIEGLLRGGYQTPVEMAATLNAVDPDTEFTEVDLIASLLEQGRTTPEEVAVYYKDHPVYGGLTPESVIAAFKDLGGNRQFAQGGNVNGYYLGGPTDGMADQIPATIDNAQPAALSDGEFVVPADVVSHLGNGNSDAGAQNLYSMMERVRTDRTGSPEQGRQIDPNKYLA